MKCIWWAAPGSYLLQISRREHELSFSIDSCENLLFHITIAWIHIAVLACALVRPLLCSRLKNAIKFQSAVSGSQTVNSVFSFYTSSYQTFSSACVVIRKTGAAQRCRDESYRRISRRFWLQLRLNQDHPQPLEALLNPLMPSASYLIVSVFVSFETCTSSLWKKNQLHNTILSNKMQNNTRYSKYDKIQADIC